MQIILNKENLSEHDCGGGLRDITAMITIDSSLSPERQKQVAIFETLAARLDSEVEDRREYVQLLADDIVDALRQLGELI